jgi:low density lipoprotein-related protein 2
MVQCDSGEEIPADWKCDGTADCADASDEIGCDSLQGFICANGETVPADWQCDGDEDCSDGTDEQNCPREAQAICQ